MPLPADTDEDWYAEHNTTHEEFEALIIGQIERWSEVLELLKDR